MGSSPDVAPGVELTNTSYAKLCVRGFRHSCTSATRGVSLTFSSRSIIADARFASKSQAAAALVLRRLFSLIHNDNLYRSLCGMEREAKLLLNPSEQRPTRRKF